MTRTVYLLFLFLTYSSNSYKSYECLYCYIIMINSKNDIVNQFWSIYNTDGTFTALSWLDTLKYYEEYCEDDISYITSKMKQL